MDNMDHKMIGDAPPIFMALVRFFAITATPIAAKRVTQTLYQRHLLLSQVINEITCLWRGCHGFSKVERI
ncbi:hypothetical protein C1T17_16220 [Sphingobium sp. SCG-1]|nr:hypothetical protein C1T17_16220 [Sphingobium sp. SCG-1]